MTTLVGSEITNMDMPVIASSMIDPNTNSNDIPILKKCWEDGENCHAKVFIDGNVIFNVESDSKLQYTAKFQTIGRIFGLQPGK